MALDWDGLSSYTSPFAATFNMRQNWAFGFWQTAVFGTYADGTRCYRIGPDNYLFKPVAQTDRVAVGFRYWCDRPEQLTPLNNGMVGFGFANGFAISPLDNNQFTVAVLSDGSIAGYTKLKTDQAGTLVGRSAPFVIRGGVEHTIEVEFVCGTTGRLRVLVDSAEVLNVPSADTDVQNVGMFDYIHFHRVKEKDAEVRYGHFWWDTETDVSTGPKQVDTLLLTGDSLSMDWTPSTGATHYNLLNEVPPNASTYVESTTPTNRDSFTFADLPVDPSTIYGVKFVAWAQKTDVEPRQISFGVADSTFSNFYDGPGKYLATSVARYDWSFMTNPADGGNPWTRATLNDVNTTLLLVE